MSFSKGSWSTPETKPPSQARTRALTFQVERLGPWEAEELGAAGARDKVPPRDLLWWGEPAFHLGKGLPHAVGGNADSLSLKHNIPLPCLVSSEDPTDGEGGDTNPSSELPGEAGTVALLQRRGRLQSHPDHCPSPHSARKDGTPTCKVGQPGSSATPSRTGRGRDANPLTTAQGPLNATPVGTLAGNSNQTHCILEPMPAPCSEQGPPK